MFLLTHFENVGSDSDAMFGTKYGFGYSFIRKIRGQNANHYIIYTSDVNEPVICQQPFLHD